MLLKRAIPFGAFVLLAAIAGADEGIGVRTVAGRAELYDTATGDRFVPRGNNYQKVANDEHVLFDVGQYNPAQITDALEQMRRDGYNVVRVFLNPAEAGSEPTNPLTEPTLNADYFNNVVDFLDIAHSNHLYVILTIGGLPDSYEYYEVQDPAATNVDGYNKYWMSPGKIIAFSKFWSEIVQFVDAAEPDLLNAILAYDIFNELAFDCADKPFSLDMGTVTPAEGGTYNMANAGSRQEAADNSAVFFFDTVAAAIKAEHADALVLASVFTPKAIGATGYDGVACHNDNRAPFRPSALEASLVDIISMHVYPWTGLTLDENLTSAEINLLGVGKPLIMGEFGAEKGQFPNLTLAAYALRSHQTASCWYRFQGWLLWTWNDSGQNYWTALDTNGAGAVNGLLAPVTRNDACLADQPTPFITASTPLTERSNFTGSVGMKITTGASSLTVYSLGRMALPGSTGYHALKFVRFSDGGDVDGARVTVDMTGAPSDSFRYATLPAPVTLAPNTAYYLVSEEVNNGDRWNDYNTTVTSTSVGTVNGPAYYPEWNPIPIPNTSFGPVSFRYSTNLVTDATPISGARNDYSGWVGMKFTTGGSALTVVSLGRMVLPENAKTHRVKLVRASDGEDVTGGLTVISTLGATVGRFQHAALPAPVTLQADTAYYLVSEETDEANADQWYDYNTQITLSSAATINQPVYRDGTTWTPVEFPGGYGYGPLDLRYVVP